MARPTEVCFSTYTTDGHFPLTVCGVGDGGPGTVLKEAWLTLPSLQQHARCVNLMKDFEPSTAVTQAQMPDQVGMYLAEARELVCNARLRQLAEQLAQQNCLSQVW